MADVEFRPRTLVPPTIPYPLETFLLENSPIFSPAKFPLKSI